jgi:hypothetical protein
MAIGSVNNFNSINSAMNIASSAVKLAADLNNGNVAGAIKDMASMFQGMGNLVGSSGSNASQGAAMPNKANEVAKLFGQDNAFEADNKKQQEAAKAAAAGGGPKSLGALLAMVGSILVKSLEATMKQLQDAAKQLDAATASGGPTAALNQKIQELTFNLQQIQQTLNKVNETVTNLSKSQSDAMGQITRNLNVG